MENATQLLEGPVRETGADPPALPAAGGGRRGGEPRRDDSTPAELHDAIAQLHAIRCATHREFLAVIAAYDRRKLWRADGATSMEAWLVMLLAMDLRTAARWVREAHELEALPVTAAAFAEGRISSDQLASLLTIAARVRSQPIAAEVVRSMADRGRPGAGHPATDGARQDGPADEAAPEGHEPEHSGGRPGPASCDDQLVRLAERCSARQLAHVVRLTRPVTTRGAEDGWRARSLAMFWDDQARVLHLRGRLPDDAGATVHAAITRLASAAPPDPETGLFERLDARCADALVGLASGHLGTTTPAHRPTVVIHADADVLAGAEGAVDVTDGPALAGETLRRIACDCRLSIVSDGPDGRPVGVGRAYRVAPPWLVDLVRRRDGGCRFGECGRTRWNQAHHLREWRAHLGATDLPNLALLCSYHHHLVHEGGWRVDGDPDAELRFTSPTGRVVSSRPAPMRREVQQWLFGRDGPGDGNPEAATGPPYAVPPRR